MRNTNGKFTKGHRGFRKSKYPDEYIINEASKYDTPTDFIKSNKTLYKYACERGLLKKIKYKKGFRINYYTDEDLLKEGSKYDTPSEFLKHNPKVYSSVVSRGLCEKIKYKVGRIGNIKKRLVYLYIFPDNHFYVGTTYNDKKREFEHSETGKTSVSKHIQKTKLTPQKFFITNSYIDAEDALKIEEETRLKYIENGYIPLNKRKCNALGTIEIKWTYKKIKECFSQCKSREEIKDKFGNGIIRAAKKIGVWDELTKDIPYLLNYYSKEEAIEIAKKFFTIQDFKKNHKSLYVIICKNDWKEEVFKHMINGKCDYVLDTQTGIFYYGLKDAIEFNSINLSLGGLRGQLTGRTKNKTNLILT